MAVFVTSPEQREENKSNVMTARICRNGDGGLIARRLCCGCFARDVVFIVARVQSTAAVSEAIDRERVREAYYQIG